MKQILALLLFATAGYAADTPNFAKPSKWEKDIAAFEAADRTNPPPQNAILFIGSSGIRLWKTLAKDFPDHRVINRGFGGSQIADSTRFAGRIIFPYKPKMIVLRAGSNDLWAKKSPEQVITDFKAFVAKVHEKLPATEIVFVSMNPTIARWRQHNKELAVNAGIAAFAKETARVKYIETHDHYLGPDGQPRADLLHTDKLHFSPEGYKILTSLIRPYLPKE
jgi:lysophospholipase L1-like esterase